MLDVASTGGVALHGTASCDSVFDCGIHCVIECVVDTEYGIECVIGHVTVFSKVSLNA